MRRLVLIITMAIVSAAALTWWRQQAGADPTIDPPEWPPFEPPVESAAAVDPADPAVETASAIASTWVAGDDALEAPVGFEIKAKESSGIFHVPGGRFYDRTSPDRWYATAEAAIADGYRQSKT